MASLLEIVRLVTMVVLGVTFILSCINLFDVITKSNYRDAETMTTVIITTVVLLVGFYGSYKNIRTYLLGFALIVIVAVIVGFVAKNVEHVSLGFSIFAAVMALVQAEMLRRSF